MAATVISTLGKLSQLAAEQAAFGQPGWTMVSANTASPNTATIAAVANVQHFVDRVTISYSAAPAVSTLQVKDGTTVIWQSEIPAAAGPYDFDFSKAPLRASEGAALSVTCSSAGGAVVQTLSVVGHSTRDIGTFT